MQVTMHGEGTNRVAVVRGDDVRMYDGQSALETIMNVCVAHEDVHKLVFPKEALAEDFFSLRTNLAGDIAQKFSNYRFQVAFVGDYSGYTSKNLRDYLYECNAGNILFFVETEEQALEKLQKA